MVSSMRLALAQINTTMGDLAGNAGRILDFARRASGLGADVAVFPELALTGYPPRDLLEKPSFVERTALELRALADATRGLNSALIVGTITGAAAGEGKRLYNSAVVISRGEIVFEQHKMLLPTYDVFDEARYFRPAESQCLFEWSGCKVGLIICEDAWNDKHFWERRLYRRDPLNEMAEAGAKVLISINASPYHMGKRTLRREMFTSAAREHGLPLVYVNQVGGNDQLVFDGSSFAMDAHGHVAVQARSFEEDLVLFDAFGENPSDNRAVQPGECDAVYEALVLGTRDYIRKCGFSRVLIGLSGGIDSSLVAAIAVDAVGAENVTGVGMPGPYSSGHSVTDARALAQNLGISFELVSINAGYQAMLSTLDPLIGGGASGVTEENLQSRLRGLTLMALSNKTGALVLTTGNKSELAVGYCTLYGDMAGGLAVISDVPKTLVYELSRTANRRHAGRVPAGVIPESVFTKPPSAELRPDQKDSDSLPDYDVLDRILRGYVEQALSPEQIAAVENVPLALAREIVNKVDRNEYKRQQAAPGIKVTSKAFGIGRRFPIAQRFSE